MTQYSVEIFNTQNKKMSLLGFIPNSKYLMYKLKIAHVKMLDIIVNSFFFYTDIITFIVFNDDLVKATPVSRAVPLG